jgi:hypothetical protein
MVLRETVCDKKMSIFSRTSFSGFGILYGGFIWFVRKRMRIFPAARGSFLGERKTFRPDTLRAQREADSDLPHAQAGGRVSRWGSTMSNGRGGSFY